MKITIDRDECVAVQSFCERCFGTLVLHPMGVERPCILALEDDQSEDLTVTLRSEGQEETLVITEGQRELIARDGWTAFVHFNPRFYRA